MWGRYLETYLSFGRQSCLYPFGWILIWITMYALWDLDKDLRALDISVRNLLCSFCLIQNSRKTVPTGESLKPGPKVKDSL